MYNYASQEDALREAIRTSQEKLNSAQLHVDICGGAGRGNTKKLEINLQ